MKKFLIGAAAITAAVFAAAPAQAAIPCQNTDISPTAIDCAGFVDGNVINNSNIATQQALLAELGFTWDGSTIVEAISPLNGTHDVDFNTLLVGETIIGVHFGNGRGGPGNATAFYLLDAGTGLDVLHLNYNASSNITVYSTGAAVPEPATWAMMLMGFGAVGSAMSRRRRKAGAVAQIA